jgi:hypothetical protein
MLYEDQFVGQGLSCQQKRKINFYPFTHFILSSVKIGALHIMFSERERVHVEISMVQYVYTCNI